MAVDLTARDDERIRYVEAFANGCRFQGFVVVKARVLDEIRKHLGISVKVLLDTILAYLQSGGRLAKVTETRDIDFGDIHSKIRHDMWPELGGRDAYVESFFKDAEEVDDRMIFIVSIHPPNSTIWN